MKNPSLMLSRIIKAGAVSFGRNLWLAIAAMVVMIVTLTIILFALIANVAFSHQIDDITSKIDVSVFLNDNVSTNQKDQLLTDLRRQPNVKSVEYLSKAQVAANFSKQNPDQGQLQQALNITGNPLPATIHITPRDLSKMDSLKQFLGKPGIAKLQSSQPSYSGARKAAIDRISHAASVLREIGIVAVIVFTAVSALIIFNTIQMAIFNRRDELRTMRLLGATTWFIRGPFVVESIIYGIISAMASIFLIWSLFFTARSALQASSLGLLDIHYSEAYFNRNFLWLLLLQLGLGILIGALSSVIATRRYLKFKSK